MNAYELANDLEISAGRTEDHGTISIRSKMAANMLRHQADYIKHLEEGLESSLNLNKAQAERAQK